MRLATSIHCPLQKTKASTTSTEFSRWMIFLEQEEAERVTKHDFYMAALTAEVRRSWVDAKHKSEISNKDFLISPKKSTSVKSGAKKQIKEPKLNKEEYLKKSKNHWMAFTKLNK